MKKTAKRNTAKKRQRKASAPPGAATGDAPRLAGSKKRAAYAAFLRGVSPMNAKMTELRRCFESAGFTDVKTVLASGNVVFSAPAAPPAALARRAEAAMQKQLGHAFPVIIRPIDELVALLATDPFQDCSLPPGAKRVVTFLQKPPSAELELPLEVDGARILCMRGSEVFTAYLPSPRGAVFMSLIEKTFGKNVTTRTWDTLAKVARQAPSGAVLRTRTP